MINSKFLTINGEEYVYTWSDKNMMIERDGEMYDEAYDPIDSGRVYVETDNLISNLNEKM